MTESARTTTFVVAAAALVAAAWAARPASPGRAVVDDKGEPFFADFNDPLAAATLKIIEFEEDAGRPLAFEVARHNGVWSIPSHDNYPADAENQFADAVASMIGLTRGTRVTDRPGDHELYGVVDPTRATSGAVGVGQRVSITTEDGRSLADLIVGKAVKDAEGQRYVRLPDRDRVYLCNVDTSKFTTDFGKWIESDLLQLNPSDVVGVNINDYSIDELNNRIVPGAGLKLTYDPVAFAWSIGDLADTEAIDTAKLNELRRSIDELTIIDVHRKPAGLSSELRAEAAMQLGMDAVQSLQRRGYFIVDGRLLSNEGETIIRTKDGVRYTLRFGEIAVTQAAGTGEDGEPAENTGRYLFVTAEFDPELLPEPDYVEIPDAASLGSALEGGEGGGASETLRAAIEQARQRAEAENATKRAEHEQAVEAGRKRARELNEHFADWYYVISDAVYRKIRLSRKDVVKVKGVEEGE